MRRARALSPSSTASESANTSKRALRRAPRLSFRRLIGRAARTDRIIKGRIAGNAWDELALLAAEICGERGVAPLTRAS